MANRAFIRAVVITLLLVAAAMACRRIGLDGDMRFFMGILRSAIYIGLFAVWGVSVRRRVTQPQARRYLAAIALLMVFWMAVRTAKYFFVQDPDAARYIWYFYYLPMLFVPLLAVFIAFSLGQPEDFRLKNWTMLFYIPTAALLLLVLTNDLHQLVFAFPPAAAVWTDRNAIHAAGYWLVFGWMALCGMTAMAFMLAKCRVPHSRTVLWLPTVPILIAALYAVAMFHRVPAVRLLMGDVTVSFCLFFMAFFECCIQCGLIQSNTHYAELFAKIREPAAIVDSAYVPRYASASALGLSKDEMRRAESGPLELPDSRLVQSMPVSGGHMLWTEDVSGILALKRELERTSRELSEENDLLEAEIAMKEKRAVADTRNRLYDSVTHEIAPQFAELERLASSADPDGEEHRAALKKLCVVGAYVKRRCNLLILNEESPTVSSAELANCLRESADYIRQWGADCTLYVSGEGVVPVGCATLAYDMFETAAELAMPSLAALLIRLSARDGGLELKLQAECAETELSAPELTARIRARGGSVESIWEDGVLYVAVRFPKGGGGQ